MPQDENYNVIIIGGGITGAALLYALSKYTNLERIALVEKHAEIGNVNTHYDNNSQTLHFGDIETNYTLEKARKVKEAAEMLARYLERYAPDAFYKSHKMVLAVGDKEVSELERRFEEFSALYPKLRKIGRDEIGRLEPMLVFGRDVNEKMCALVTEDGYTVNFKKTAESFVREARGSGKHIDIFPGTEVTGIEKTPNGFTVRAAHGVWHAGVVAVMAGPHSLVFARSIGYGAHLGILPVAGNFYRAHDMLRGKVYTMQIAKLPFAAVHGDPAVTNPRETRFGPTAKVLPMLERHQYRTILDFLKTSVWNMEGVLSLLKIISDPVLFIYVIKNLAYEIPLVGKWLFLQEVRKIVPSLTLGELHFGKGIGGIRPQVVNTTTKKLEMGEAEIVGDRILFNITPSPGASVCLKNAEQEAAKIVAFFGGAYRFDAERWCQDFGSSMAECRE